MVTLCQSKSNYKGMKKIITLALGVILAINASAQEPVKDWARTNKYAERNAEVKVKPVAVFMGDSITEQWYGTDKPFFTDNNYLGRGISGQTTAHMLVRFHSDVVDLHPKYVAIMAGTNDIAGNNGPIAIDKIADNIIAMCEIAKANKIKPIICSVTPVNRYGWSKIVTGDPSPIIMELNSKLEAYAAKTKGVQYVDYFSALKTEANGIQDQYTKDGCHLTLEGYKVIEALISARLK